MSQSAPDSENGPCGRSAGELPFPPHEMRMLVGPTDDIAFDNPSGDLVFPCVDAESYDTVFDFGCGCGRIARQLIQQRVQPKEYVGTDLHRGMIRWCQDNLTPAAPQFTFHHHDVFNYVFNPGDAPMVLQFPVDDGRFTLVNAHSVFTHLTQSQTEHYLAEVRRIIADRGVFRSTWFLFDRALFPMLHDFQGALYTSEFDLSGAVLYEREWMLEQTRRLQLTVTHVIPPHIRGHQWEVLMQPSAPGVVEAQFPEDAAALGRLPPPMPTGDASRVGL